MLPAPDNWGVGRNCFLIQVALFRDFQPGLWLLAGNRLASILHHFLVDMD